MRNFNISKMKKYLFRAILVLFFTSASTAVYACRCPTPSTSKAYKNAFLVVRATALSIENHPDKTQTAILKVSNAWKENVEIEIKVTGGGEVCGHFFAENQEYILYIYKDAQGNYTTRNCVGNKFFNNPALSAGFVKMAKNDVVWLNKHAKKGKIG